MGKMIKRILIGVAAIGFPLIAAGLCVVMVAAIVSIPRSTGCDQEAAGAMSLAQDGAVGGWTSLIDQPWSAISKRMPAADRYCASYQVGQCTWWACMRETQLGHHVDKLMGNGADWAASARRKLGWRQGAAAGGIASFPGGALGSARVYGHVAVVEQVDGDQVWISETGSSLGRIVKRRVSLKAARAAGVTFWHPAGETNQNPDTQTGQTAQAAVSSSDPSASSVIASYTGWAQRIAADDSHGYSQPRRASGVDYDCSSLVYFALKQAGVKVGSTPFTTITMDGVLAAAGFHRFSWKGDLTRLEAGDILVNPVAHTEIYLGSGRFVAARQSETGGIDGKPGDQTGREIAVQSVKNGSSKAWMANAYRLDGAPVLSPVADCLVGGPPTAGAPEPVLADYRGDGRHATPEQAKRLVRTMAKAYGWDEGDQWRALLWIGQTESGWRWDATNPSSGAYGIAQALPASKMSGYGSDWHDNAATQIRFLLDYIKKRYGSPQAAKSFHLRTGWY